MAKIKKIQSGAKSSFVWMGTCDDGEDCQDFDLTSYADGESNAGIISSVFQMADNNIAGVWKSDQPAFVNDLNDGSTNNNKMLCGKNYFIKLHPATSGADESEIEIPGAIFDYKGQAGKGKVFNKDSTRPQFLGDVSNLPSCIAKGEFRNLITKAEDATDYATSETITPDKDGIYVKADGTVHRIFSGKPFNIPAGSKLFKGKFGTLDTDGDGVPDEYDTEPSVSDRNSAGGGLPESFRFTGFVGKNDMTPGFSNVLFTWNPSLSRYEHSESSWSTYYIKLHQPSDRWMTWTSGNDANYISMSNDLLDQGSLATRSGISITDVVYPSISGSSGGSSGGITGSIEAGDNSSFVLKADGSLHAAGSNNNGQLGDGTTDSRNSFSEVGLSGVSQIAAGKWHTLFIKTDGSLHSAPASGWPVSLGGYGQRGDPSQHTSGVSQVAAGEYHSLMLKSDGSFWSTGYGTYGQLGDGTRSRGEFVKVIDSGVAQIAAGANHSFIVKTDGSLWGMGKNDNGQLGDGTTTNRTTPTQIATGVSQISAGYYHSLILSSNGSLWAMGKNNFGQLGDGTTTTRTNPTRILASGVSQISAGLFHSLILKSDGSLWTMGQDGSGTNHGIPTQILASGVAQIAAGGEYSLIVKSDGSLHAFGRNQSGQLGDGTNTRRATPVEILPAGSI